jgi:hypothetical protein
VSPDPFGALGLPVRADLTDDDVRAAWRRIAAATHPDRDDGGDPARFAEAAAAYTELRTRYGRGEAYADLSAGRRLSTPVATPSAAPSGLAGFDPGPAGTSRPAGPVGPLAGRIARGRPWLLALRLAIAVAISVAAFAATGAQPGAIGLTVGAATWFLLTARHDLAPPGR